MTKKLITCLLIFLCLCTCLAPFNVIWADTSAIIAFGSSSVKTGEEVTVTLRFTNDTANISKVDCYLTYDATIIEFVPANGIEGGDGMLHIVENAIPSTDKLSVTLTFRAVKAGSTRLAIENCQLSDEIGNTVGTPSASANLTVTNPTVFLSSNANLESLTISYGTLAPEFSPSITEYTVVVENSVTKFPVSAKPEDDKAKASITENQTLEVGMNQRIITVVAEDGTEKKYTITIVRLEPEGTTSPETSTPDTGETPTATPSATQSSTATQSPTPTQNSTQSPGGITNTPSTSQSAGNTAGAETSPTPTTASTPVDPVTDDDMKNAALTIIVIVAIIIIVVLFTVVYCMQQKDQKRRGRGKRR